MIVADFRVIFFQTHRIAQHVFRGILHICPCRLSGTKAVSGKAIHTRMGKILQQPFGILLFEISNDNSFGFDIYFLEKDFLALDSAKDSPLSRLGSMPQSCTH